MPSGSIGPVKFINTLASLSDQVIKLKQTSYSDQALIKSMWIKYLPNLIFHMIEPLIAKKVNLAVSTLWD